MLELPKLLFFVLVGLATFLFLRLVYSYLQLQYQVRRLGHIPHVKQLFHFTSLWVNIAPRWLFPYDYTAPLIWTQVFEEKKSPVISFICSDSSLVVVKWVQQVKPKCICVRCLHFLKSDADIVKDIINSEFPKPNKLYDIVRVYGDNIISISESGPEWKKHRALCSPAFSISNLKLVGKVVESVCDKFFKEWEANAVHESSHWEVQVDMLPAVTKMTLAVITEAGFGSDIVFEPEAGSNHTLSFWNCMNLVTNMMILRLAFPNLVKLSPFGKPKVARDAFAEFEQYMKEFIAERKKKQKVESNENGRADLLSLLLRAEDSSFKIRLSDQEILSNIFVFLFAGHETTSHSLAFAFGLLACHPDAQQKVYDEVQQLLHEKKEAGEQLEGLTYDDYKKLSYTLCVFKETLRLFPPVHSVPKMSTEDLEIGGYMVPKETTIMISVLALHRNDKYWPDPDLFKPERFLKSEECGNSVNPYAFAPFSLGRRSCIGMKFAEVEAVLLLANVVKSFSLHVPPGTNPATLLEMTDLMTVTPKNGTKLLLRKREE
ncbi:Cytochrome P-450 like protein [Balamuthia mandrillaris]